MPAEFRFSSESELKLSRVSFAGVRLEMPEMKRELKCRSLTRELASKS